MKTSGRITISRMGMSSNPENNTIILELEDYTSGLRLLSLEMTPEDYGMLVGGAGARVCEITNLPNDYVLKNVGKRFVGEEVFLKNFNARDYHNEESDAKAEIRDRLTQELADGWVINSYGLTSRQDDKRGHKVHIKKYV